MMGALLLLILVVAGITISLYVSARQVSSELPGLEDRLANYRAREVEHPSDLLPQAKLAELRVRVQALNELTNTTKQTLPQLLAIIEGLVPDGAWIVNLNYRARANEAKLVVEADRAEHLTDFMERLERSGQFSQVLLTRQTQRSENSRNIQFEIQLRGNP